jgi:hypothetical protein
MLIATVCQLPRWRLSLGRKMGHFVTRSNLRDVFASQGDPEWFVALIAIKQ